MSKFDHFGILAPFYEYFIKPRHPDFLADLLDLPVDGALLDAGGGTGRLAQFMVGKAKKVVVADLSCQMLTEAKGKDHLFPVCTPTEIMPFPNGAFARIIMVDALHHVIHQRDTIRELWRLLARGGRIVIEEPDIRSFRIKIIAAGEKLLLMRSHFLSPEQISELFNFKDAVIENHQDGPIAYILVKKLRNR